MTWKEYIRYNPDPSAVCIKPLERLGLEKGDVHKISGYFINSCGEEFLVIEIRNINSNRYNTLLQLKAERFAQF